VQLEAARVRRTLSSFFVQHVTSLLEARFRTSMSRHQHININGLMTYTRAAMESWLNGREEFVEELMKVYDKVGTRVASGIASDVFSRAYH
jgi:hypothetical protein